MAYARCVCITSFDRPVVPDVGMSTARSSGPTSSGRVPSGSSTRQSPTVASMSSTPSVARSRTPPASTSGSKATSVSSSARPDLTDEAGELVRAAGRVGGHGDGADGGQRQPAQQVGRGRARGDHDQVAPSYSHFVQPLGKPGDLAVRAGERQRSLIGAQPYPCGVAIGGSSQQPRDGLGHASPCMSLSVAEPSGGSNVVHHEALRPLRTTRAQRFVACGAEVRLRRSRSRGPVSWRVNTNCGPFHPPPTAACP